MKVYVVQTPIEDIDINYSYAEVFFKLDAAKKWADEEIDSYAEEYDGSVVERAEFLYQMQSGDTWVTIDIVGKEIH